jgi:UDP-glucose 4-epimerase
MEVAAMIGRKARPVKATRARLERAPGDPDGTGAPQADRAAIRRGSVFRGSVYDWGPMRDPLYLVTGGAGFIGSQLVERLLRDGARVRLLDNFSSGTRENLAFARAYRRRLEVIRGDLRKPATVERAARGVRVIYHQAAMRSVPRSVKDPLGANDNNVTGTLHVLEAARRARVPRVVYASSSSVYGDAPELPKREDQAPAPVSPYAVSKRANELYAAVWSRLYGVETVGLRYFNVFGPRQDPKSEYAAVIPRFILWGLTGQRLEVHGDGAQTRDFTYIDNVVEANLLAARATDAPGEVFNVGCGTHTSLLEIISMLETILGRSLERRHTPPRAGDVPHTLADIGKAKRLLGYEPLVDFEEGFRRTVEFFRERQSR